jgi:hypothetical protein
VSAFFFTKQGGAIDGVKLVVEVHRRWPELPMLLTSSLVTLRQSELPRHSRFMRKPYAAADVVRWIGDLVGNTPLPNIHG